MSFLAKGKKQDLLDLAQELDITVDESFKVVNIKDAIIKSSSYDEEFTKELFDRIVKERKEREDRDEKEKDRMFELERLKLEAVIAENKRSESGSVLSSADTNLPKLEISKLLPNFNEKTDDMSLFLNLFERQLSFLKVPQSKWVVYLIGLLPSEIAKLIAKETDAQDGTQDYENVKKILLRRFKMSSEKFRQQFAQHQKNTDSTWRDFYYDLKNYFEGWLGELNITTFDELKKLIIADQVKRRCPPDYKDHFLDHWSEWNDPVFLSDKLDGYEEIRTNKNYSREPKRREFVKNWQSNEPSNTKTNKYDYKYVSSRDTSKSEERILNCYGCGKQGFIKAKCPTCSPSTKVQSAQLYGLKFRSCSLHEKQTTLLKIKVNGMLGLAYADTGASHTIAGETLFKCLKDQGIKFEKTSMDVTLADGIAKNTEVYKTQIDVELECHRIPIILYALPMAKDNRTLLGTDFLCKAGTVLDMQNNQWYFVNNPKQKFNFAKDEVLPSPESIESIVEVQTSVLEENEGKCLTSEQKLETSKLLKKCECIFEPGGEPTPYIEHSVNTANHPPISDAPYGMSPTCKEFLKKEIGDILEKEKIEECELSAVNIDFPTRTPNQVRGNQLKHEKLGKNIHCFKQDTDVTPVQPVRGRGRPPEHISPSASTISGPLSRRHRYQRGSM